MSFNPHEPHGVVSGLPGVMFEQNGRLYRRDGTEVNEDGEPVSVTEPAPEPDPDPAPAMKDYSDMSDHMLKALISQYHVDWSGRKNAVAYLRSLNA